MKTHFFLLFLNTSMLYLIILCKFDDVSPIFCLSYCNTSFIYKRTTFQKFHVTMNSFMLSSPKFLELCYVVVPGFLEMPYTLSTFALVPLKNLYQMEHARMFHKVN